MAINKKVAAAMKKVAKPKRKKTWADSQSAPQSKVYKAANDKAVLAKPVGFRWTDLGAARLGKNASVKPSAADIEKYKGKTFSKGGQQHNYLYSEKRADKTDVKKSEKFKAGGRPKKTWADSQNPPQSTVYKAANDKEVVAKPVGWRWTGYGANKLGVNVMSKPSAADIEKYKNKTFKLRGENVRYLYSEKRADKSDVKRKDKFADGGMMARGGFVTNLEEAFKSDRLEAELKSKMKEGDAIVAFAYSDYGGDFFDKVAIEYFKENHPDNIVYEKSAYSGQNGIVFGEPAEEFLEAANNYLLGYENIEDLYYQMEYDQTAEDYEYFLNDLERDGYKVSDDALSYLLSEKSGYYSMQPNQLDYNSTNLTDELLKEGLIKKEMANGGMMAKGGATKKDFMYEVGDFFDVEDPNSMDFIRIDEINKSKNKIDYTKVNEKNNTITKHSISIDNFQKKLDSDVWGFAMKGKQEGYMADGGKFKRGGTFGGRQYDPYNEPADKARHAKPIGWRFTDAKAKRLKESPYEKPTAEQIEKYRGKGVYFENRQDKSDKTYSRKLADGGLADNEVLRVKYVSVDVHESSYENGEGSYVTGYTMPEFKGKTIDDDKVITFLMNKLYLSGEASDYVIIDNCIQYNQLQDEDGMEASEYDKEQWREGKKVLYSADYTICFDAVTERNITDEELSAITGIGVYRSGGAVQSGVQSENYSEDRDKLVVAKPVGWRFTNKFAKRKGFDAYRKPTAEEIEKYKGSGKVYYEVRFDKSDKNVRRRFANGGMMADGGYTKRERVIDYYFDNDVFDDPYSYDLEDSDLKDYKKVEKAIIKYHGLDNDANVEERFETLGLEEYADGGMMARGGELKEYLYNFKGGGWNSISAHNKAEAIKLAKARHRNINKSDFYAGPKLEVDESSFRIKTEKDYKNLISQFYADGGMMEDDSYARGGAPKISNVESRSYTENMLPFKAANLEAKTLDNGDYVVLSYGYYPIWFYSKATHKWYGNKDKYSQTTAKQISQSRPTYDATILSKSELDEVMFSSSLGKLHDEERIVEANV